MTITLPPDIEKSLAEEAQRQGTTVERLALASLRERFCPAKPVVSELLDEPPAETPADFLKDFIGVLNSGENIPGGADMSVDCGKKFAEGMVRKHRECRL